jgi:bacterial/archaeal transporter family protein
MKPWILYALLSMVFAGFTVVIAKMGLAGISSELGLTIRTAFVFVFVMLFAACTVPSAQWSDLQRSHWLWLGLSGVTTTLSWIFYHKALKDGDVSTVALIDKGSVVVALLLAVLILKERLTLRLALGSLLMVSGLLVMARR